MYFENYYIPSLILICSILILLSCRDKGTSEPQKIDYTYSEPIQTDDGWTTSDLNEVNLSKNKLTEMVNFIEDEANQRIHGVLIVKDSKLVFEKYFKGFTFDANYVQTVGDLIEYGRDTLHYMASVSKSVTSLLLGIAIDKGAHIDINERLVTYYPEYDKIISDTKAAITVGHLLTMSAGLSWDESSYNYGDSRNDVTQLFNQDDPIKFVLQKPLQTLPGAEFNYNSGYTNILGDLIQRKTLTSFIDFAEQFLFRPLEINNYKWDTLNSSLTFASGGLYLTPRSLAKIGNLFFTEGEWNQKKIISNQWLNQSNLNYVSRSFNGFSDGYGLHWWRYTFNTYGQTFESFFAAGWGEQFMFLFPDLNMLVVFTSGYFFDLIELSPHSLINDYILPATLVQD